MDFFDLPSIIQSFVSSFCLYYFLPVKCMSHYLEYEWFSLSSWSYLSSMCVHRGHRIMIKGNQVVNLFSKKVEKVLVGQFYSCNIQFKLGIIYDPAW